MINYIVMKAIMIMPLLYIHYQLINSVVQKLKHMKYEFVNINCMISAMSTYNLDELVNYKSKVIT